MTSDGGTGVSDVQNFQWGTTTSPLTRGEARAVEQAMIERNPGFENKINSISPNHDWFDQAVEWGENWLRSNGL